MMIDVDTNGVKILAAAPYPLQGEKGHSKPLQSERG